MIIRSQKIINNLDAIKKEKLRLLKEKRDREYKELLDQYPLDERETFKDRCPEAKAYMTNNTSPTPFIDASMPEGYTEEQRVEEINAVYQKALYIAKLGGESRGLRNKIESVKLEDYKNESEAIAALEDIEI